MSEASIGCCADPIKTTLPTASAVSRHTTPEWELHGSLSQSQARSLHAEGLHKVADALEWFSCQFFSLLPGSLDGAFGDVEVLGGTGLGVAGLNALEDQGDDFLVDQTHLGGGESEGASAGGGGKLIRSLADGVRYKLPQDG